MKSQIRFTSGVTAALLAGAMSVGASTVTYDFGTLTGGTAPNGTPPWLEAVFSDNGQPANTVQLTVSAGNLTGNEFVSCWYFNLNPALDPLGLTVTATDSTGSFIDPTVLTGANSFKAGQDGKFDMLLGFNTGASASGHFGAGNSITFTITDPAGLTANDFDWVSTAAGGSQPYTSAAHVEGISDDGADAWINPTSTLLQSSSVDRSVPDGAATISLLGASLLAIEGFRRTLRTRSAR
jgi:hypothetical protein